MIQPMVRYNQFALDSIYFSRQSYRRTAASATICSRPGLQRKRAAAALSEAGQVQSANYAPPSRPHTPLDAQIYATGVRQTCVRQYHHLMPPGGIKIPRPIVETKADRPRAHCMKLLKAQNCTMRGKPTRGEMIWQ